MNKKGFTLIELLVTLAIAGILAGGAVTAYVGVTKKAARSEAYANLESIALLQEQFYADNGTYGPISGENSFYLATPNDTDDGIGIEDFLPKFKPGGCIYCLFPHELDYMYRMFANSALNNPSVPFEMLRWYLRILATLQWQSARVKGFY